MGKKREEEEEPVHYLCQIQDCLESDLFPSAENYNRKELYEDTWSLGLKNVTKSFSIRCLYMEYFQYQKSGWNI